MLLKYTLFYLFIDASHIWISKMMVVTYDTTLRQIIRDIDIELGTGPYQFLVTMHVIDILPICNMFLGRSWIHSIIKS